VVTALLQVLQDGPAARYLGQLAQEPLHLGPIQVHRRWADPLIHPSAAWCQLDPTNSPGVSGRIPPGALIKSPVAVEQKAAGSLVSEDDEAAIIPLHKAEELHVLSHLA
jgi:hypothetical protein